MDLIAERVEVWAASLEDKPGSLANILSSLREAGANLNFILARREPINPASRLFMLPRWPAMPNSKPPLPWVST